MERRSKFLKNAGRALEVLPPNRSAAIERAPDPAGKADNGEPTFEIVGAFAIRGSLEDLAKVVDLRKIGRALRRLTLSQRLARRYESALRRGYLTIDDHPTEQLYARARRASNAAKRTLRLIAARLGVS